MPYNVAADLQFSHKETL